MLILTILILLNIGVFAAKKATASTHSNLAARAHRQRATLHRDHGALRFCGNHLAARRFCTVAHIRFWWAEIQWTRRELAETRRALSPVLEVNDWLTAVAYVQRWYPGSGWWLRSCSASEGGHGAWVANHQGSGAGGWMQYFESTFWTDFRAAVRDLNDRGVDVPFRWRSWYSPVGQALAAGWAYSHDRPTGKWVGSGC